LLMVLEKNDQSWTILKCGVPGLANRHPMPSLSERQTQKMGCGGENPLMVLAALRSGLRGSSRSRGRRPLCKGPILVCGLSKKHRQE
jgi:hypothetical protein